MNLDASRQNSMKAFGEGETGSLSILDKKHGSVFTGGDYILQSKEMGPYKLKEREKCADWITRVTTFSYFLLGRHRTVDYCIFGVFSVCSKTNKSKPCKT